MGDPLLVLADPKMRGGAFQVSGTAEVNPEANPAEPGQAIRESGRSLGRQVRAAKDPLRNPCKCQGQWDVLEGWAVQD